MGFFFLSDSPNLYAHIIKGQHSSFNLESDLLRGAGLKEQFGGALDREKNICISFKELLSRGNRRLKHVLFCYREMEA